MTIFTERPVASDHFQESGFDQLSGAGTAFGTAFEDQLQDNPLADLSHVNQLSMARSGAYVGGGRVMAQRNPFFSPTLSPEEANARFGIDGQLKFDRPVRQKEAELLHGWKTEAIQRQDILARADQSGLAQGERFGARLLAMALDPVNVATSFIPVVGEARFAYLAGKVGKIGATVVKGAVEGATGAALTEPLHYFESRQEQEDYSAADSLANIAFGSILGGGLHLGAAGIRKALGKGIGGGPFGNQPQSDPRPSGSGAPDASPQVLNVTKVGREVGFLRNDILERGPIDVDFSVVNQIDRLPLETRQALLQGAVAARLEGRPADVGERMAERNLLRKGIQHVTEKPIDDPDKVLATINASDIDQILVHHGPAIEKENGEIVIKGRGHGLVKVVWEHGEKGNKVPELQVRKEDILAFPDVVRDYEPSQTKGQFGDEGYRREWRIRQPDGRIAVYATTRWNKADRLVTIYIQKGEDGLPLSRQKKTGASDSSSRIMSPAEDTTGGLRPQLDQGRDAPAEENISFSRPENKEATPDHINEMASKGIDESNLQTETEALAASFPDHPELREADQEIERAAHRSNARNALGQCLLKG